MWERACYVLWTRVMLSLPHPWRTSGASRARSWRTSWRAAASSLRGVAVVGRAVTPVAPALSLLERGWARVLVRVAGLSLLTTRLVAMCARAPTLVGSRTQRKAIPQYRCQQHASRVRRYTSAHCSRGIACERRFPGSPGRRRLMRSFLVRSLQGCATIHGEASRCACVVLGCGQNAVQVALQSVLYSAYSSVTLTRVRIYPVSLLWAAFRRAQVRFVVGIIAPRLLDLNILRRSRFLPARS